MPINIEIPDNELNGFSEQAQDSLKLAIGEYTSEIIEEANRLEAGRNSTNGPPEVTRGMVSDAKVLLRRGLGSPKMNWGLRILRIIAAVLSLLVGIMYDESKMQGSYLLFFILVVAVTIFAVTLSTLKE